MFAVVNACQEKEDLPECTKKDSLILAADCLIVAALVTLVCLAVIGKVRLGLPGPVGTVNNPWIQAMIGVSAGLFAADLIAAVVKWKARLDDKETNQLYEQYRKLEETIAGTLSQKILEKYPRYMVCMASSKYMGWEGILKLHAKAHYQPTDKIRDLSIEESTRRLASISTNEIDKMIAFAIPERELTSVHNLGNLNAILKQWFAMDEVDEAARDRALRWCYANHYRQGSDSDKIISYDGAYKLAGAVGILEAAALYHIYQMKTVHAAEMKKMGEYFKEHSIGEWRPFKDKIKDRLGLIADALGWHISDPKLMHLD